MHSLKGKVIAITGIGSPDTPMGNGRAIAELFAAQGGFIEGIDLLEEEGMRTKKAIIANGGDCQFTQGDVTSEADIENWITGRKTDYRAHIYPLYYTMGTRIVSNQGSRGR